VLRCLAFCWFVGWLSLLQGSAQTPAPLVFDHLTPTDGLPHSSVFDQLEDRRGFLWLATGDGLARYDGYAFKVYRHRPSQPSSLSSSHIEELFEDRRGRLWVGTSGQGLNRLNPDGETFRTHWGRGQLARTTVASLAETPDGTLWIGTAERGLWRLDSTESLRAVRLPRPHVSALLTDADGALWVGMRGYVLRRAPDGRSARLYRLPAPDPAYAHHNTVSCLFRDRRGRLWAGTRGNGLFVLDPRAGAAFRRVLYEPGLYENRNLVTDVCEDHRGQLWIATDAGVLLCPGGDLARRQHLMPAADGPHSLSTFATKRMHCDRAGNVWLGSWEGGVNVWYAHPTPFRTLGYEPRSAQTLLKPKVAALATTAAGLWIGSIQGLSLLNSSGALTHFTSRNSALSSDDVSHLLATPRGGLLVSTWTRGFDYVPPGARRFVALGPQMGRSKSVRAFALGRNGRVWISTQENQLFRFDENQLTVTPVDVSALARSLSNFSVISLLEDDAGEVWLGTYESELIRWNPATGRWRVFSPRNRTFPGSRVSVLFVDRHRRLWVGTTDRGLARFDANRQRFVTYGLDHGLPSSAVASVLEDAAGRLWVATNGGLSVFDERRGRFRTFYESDGVLGQEFIPNAAAVRPDGSLAFGSTKGLTQFRPETVLRPAAPPPVYLTGLRIFNKPVLPTDPATPLRTELTQASALTLRHDQSVFTLEFTGLALHRPQNVRYAYQLVGIDPDWNDVGTQRAATYTNLTEGTYAFRVKAALGNGPWGTPRTLTLTIRPPWYRSGWAYAAYLLLGTGLVGWFRRTVRVRERLRADVRIQQTEARHARALDEAKTGFFTNISHEFRTPLTLILTPLERLLSQSDGEPQAHQYRVMHRNATRLLRLINQLLDLSKLESGSLVPRLARHDVVAHLRALHQSFEGWAESKRIDLRFSTSADSHWGWFDADFLEKVGYNLLANALKFTPEGGEIRLDARLTPDERLVLTVADTGCGISAEHLPRVFDRFYQTPEQTSAGTGVGLALARELVELHQGQISVTSQPLLGTTFRVDLPLHPAAFPPDWLDRRSGAEPEGAEVPRLAHPVSTPSVPLADDQPILLIAEDNDELRQYLTESFQTRYRVVTARDGREALSRAVELVPDVVVSDWLMPYLGGVDLCRALKADERTNHVPFLLLTSRSGPQHQLTALEAGPDDYVTKPFNLSVLERKLDNLLRTRQLLREKWNRSFTLGPLAQHLPTPDEAFLRKAVEQIEQHLDDATFDVEQLEQALNLSRMQLYRKLKSLTNRSGSEFIRLVRLQRGRDLLETGHYSVKEAAFQVGFNDPAYFSRVFKKEFGVPPQQVVA
jgi:signal transduction histidine kinase/ligand-binding sensor domain-containing protein/DNA-binding response OmpR family regulator